MLEGKKCQGPLFWVFIEGGIEMEVQDYLAGRCLTQAEVQEVWKLAEARGQSLEAWIASLPSKPALTGPPWICGRSA